MNKKIIWFLLLILIILIPIGYTKRSFSFIFDAWSPDKEIINININSFNNTNPNEIDTYKSEKEEINAFFSEFLNSLANKKAWKALSFMRPGRVLSYRTFFINNKEHLPELAESFSKAKLTFYHKSNGSLQDYNDTAELAFPLDGNTYHLALIKISNKWYISTL